MFWRRALLVSAAAVLLSLPGLAQQPQAADPQASDSGQQQPQAVPADSQSQTKPPSGIKKVLRRAAPNCVQVAGRQDCWSESEQQKESEQKAQQTETEPQQPPVPQSQPLPRSDAGVSSSRDTKIGPSAPLGDAAGPVGPGNEVRELHPYNPHRADKDVEVGDFYFKRHNYIAAESRYASALLWMPNDAIASYRLAQAQEKLGKVSEARKNYQDYLKILPHGEYAEEAQKALQRLNLKMQSQETAPTSPPGQTRPY